MIRIIDRETYNTDTDPCIYRVDEPAYMTDRTRWALHINKHGTYYIHCDSDREKEEIETLPGIVKTWINIELAEVELDDAIRDKLFEISEGL